MPGVPLSPRRRQKNRRERDLKRAKGFWWLPFAGVILDLSAPTLRVLFPEVILNLAQIVGALKVSLAYSYNLENIRPIKILFAPLNL